MCSVQLPSASSLSCPFLAWPFPALLARAGSDTRLYRSPFQLQSIPSAQQPLEGAGDENEDMEEEKNTDSNCLGVGDWRRSSLGLHRKHPHPAARFPFPEITTLGSRVSARHLKTDDQCLLGNSLCQSQLEFISREADKPLRAPCLPRAGGVGPVQLAADKHRQVSLEGPCLSMRVLFLIS